jgi:(2Fe-2S) ferredoxin
MVVEMTSPGISPYGRHIFICANGNCANSAQVTELIQYLHQLNRQHGLDQLSNPQRIAYVKCGCLGVCSNGPIMIVYPEGIWYRAIDSTSLAQIYEEHLLGGEPVEAYILHRHYQPAVPIQAAAERAAVEKEAQRRAAASEPLPDHVIAARQRRQQRRSQ